MLANETTNSYYNYLSVILNGTVRTTCKISVVTCNIYTYQDFIVSALSLLKEEDNLIGWTQVTLLHYPVTHGNRVHILKS